MGNREYVMTFTEEPIYKKGDKYTIYLGKGYYIDGEVYDIRFHNLAKQYIMRVRIPPNNKKYSYYPFDEH